MDRTQLRGHPAVHSGLRLPAIREQRLATRSIAIVRDSDLATTRADDDRPIQKCLRCIPGSVAASFVMRDLSWRSFGSTAVDSNRVAGRRRAHPGEYAVGVVSAVGGGEPEGVVSLDVGQLLGQRAEFERAVLSPSVSTRRVVS
jgi:hypothetical protein